MVLLEEEEVQILQVGMLELILVEEVVEDLIIIQITREATEALVS